MAYDREDLGKEVRRIWIEWAKEQPAPKPHWLTEWSDLGEQDKEVDRRIGEGIVAFVQPKPTECGHGVEDGEWCRECGMQYKAAREDPENHIQEEDDEG